MTPRERFNKQMRFEQVDHPVRWETLGFWGQTIARWRTEGMSENVDPEEYFEMTPRAFLPIDTGLTELPYYPKFEYEELERTESYVIFRSSSGIIQKQRADHGELSMPQWLSFPTQTRADFEKIRDERLDAGTPECYPDWEEFRKLHSNRTIPYALSICGAYGTPRNFFGEDRLAYVYYDDPELIHDIMRWWLDFYTEIVSTITKNFPGIDYVFWWEDMAHKTGPLISPDFVRKFMIPYMEPLIDHIKSCGIETVLLDTDGNAEVLMGIFLSVGINAMMPFEIAAGMEPLEIRKRYGRRLALVGGIDKRAVAAGGDVMRGEVMKKVPNLLKDGGYIPTLDHSTPPDISLDNHRAFIDLLRELGDKYGG